MLKAKVIDERSAGMTVVQIYDDEEFVWSHNYFINGATSTYYKQGMIIAYNDVIRLEDVSSYEGCDIDDEGNIIDYDEGQAFCYLSYTALDGWKIEENPESLFGQCLDFVKLNEAKFPDEIIAAYKNNEYYDR